MLKSERRRAEATVNANNDEMNEHGGRERPKHFKHFTKQFDKMHFVQSAFATQSSRNTHHTIYSCYSLTASSQLYEPRTNRAPIFNFT